MLPKATTTTSRSFQRRFTFWCLSFSSSFELNLSRPSRCRYHSLIQNLSSTSFTMSSVSDTTPCKVCQKTSGPETKLSTCAKCKVPTYCGRDCQAKNWPAHKRYCGGPWWDNFRVRKCRDGSLHEGKPELITGSTPANLESDDYSEDTGWGGTPEEDVDYLKSQFEVRLLNPSWLANVCFNCEISECLLTRRDVGRNAV